MIANSGAAKAGVRSGDLVTALDNNKVDTFDLFMSVSFIDTYIYYVTGFLLFFLFDLIISLFHFISFFTDIRSYR